jgi:hypothetical protein
MTLFKEVYFRSNIALYMRKKELRSIVPNGMTAILPKERFVTGKELGKLDKFMSKDNKLRVIDGNSYLNVKADSNQLLITESVKKALALKGYMKQTLSKRYIADNKDLLPTSLMTVPFDSVLINHTKNNGIRAAYNDVYNLSTSLSEYFDAKFIYKYIYETDGKVSDLFVTIKQQYPELSIENYKNENVLKLLMEYVLNQQNITDLELRHEYLTNVFNGYSGKVYHMGYNPKSQERSIAKDFDRLILQNLKMSMQVLLKEEALLSKDYVQIFRAHASVKRIDELKKTILRTIRAINGECMFIKNKDLVENILLTENAKDNFPIKEVVSTAISNMPSSVKFVKLLELFVDVKPSKLNTLIKNILANFVLNSSWKNGVNSLKEEYPSTHTYYNSMKVYIQSNDFNNDILNKYYKDISYNKTNISLLEFKKVLPDLDYELLMKVQAIMTAPSVHSLKEHLVLFKKAVDIILAADLYDLDAFNDSLFKDSRYSRLLTNAYKK